MNESLVSGHTCYVPISDNRLTPAELLLRTAVREAVGSAIRLRRRAAGFSQVQLAERASISHRELGRIERGVGGIQTDRLWPIAAALDCNPSDLIRDAETILRSADPKRSGD